MLFRLRNDMSANESSCASDGDLHRVISTQQVMYS